MRLKIRNTNLVGIGLLIALVCFSASQVIGQDTQEADRYWPQFRGPRGNGVAPLATPPTTWSPDAAKWKTEIPGRGSASPIVWANRIFILTAVDTGRAAESGDDAVNSEEGDAAGEDQPQRRRGAGRGRRPARAKTWHEFRVICIDRNTGDVMWNVKVNEEVPHESGHPTNTHASASPVTDGKHVWASFNSYGLFCLDMDGKVIWERHLGKMTTRREFGEGASPAVHGDTLVLNWDHEGQSFIEVMDALTGKTRWRKDRDEATTWSTPVIVEHNGVVQVVTNGATRVRSYDLETGDILWECGGQTDNPIPTPMVIDDIVVCMTGFRRNAAVAIRLDSRGDLTDSDQIVWQRRDIGPYVPTGTLYKGWIYATKGSSPILNVVDAKTGETIIDDTRLDGLRTMYASMVAANDHIYVTGRSGRTLVIKHGKPLNIVAENDLGEPVDATPAPVENQIIIRSDKHLYCFENSESTSR